MAMVTRRWYLYNCAPGGQLSAQNYFFITNFPNACAVPANNICAVLGIYSETLSGAPPSHTGPIQKLSPPIQISKVIILKHTLHLFRPHPWGSIMSM